MSMIDKIICSGCGTEVDWREIDKSESGKCTICGKVLLDEILKKKQNAERSGENKLGSSNKKGINSRKMGRKLQELGDDDLFGDLEPFNLDDRSDFDEEDELMSGNKSKTKVRKLSESPSEANSKRTQSTDDIEVELDDDEKFENPMAKSSLMKKLKDDQDLFGSLDS